MPRRSIPATSNLEAEVRRLERELYMARATIIGLMVPEIGTLLGDHFACKTYREVREWADSASGSIIEISARTENPVGRERDGRIRVRCPLCNQGPQSPYDQGFLIEEGLRRHLLGTYNSRQCSVFAAAYQMALSQLPRGAI
ncbi:hypothetical protein [Paraburkholderia heleia]|uniref:hypothetical protein n=1 Tax=Paraburkholderia heleia TaxID=634127 RepID=UPI002AB5E3D4|nr:hypothetical protein [Paraburkholderia heleia]